MKTINILAAALLAGSLTAATGIGHVAQAHAQAQTPASRTVAVHHGDLDLGSAAGRRALDHRVRQAIRSACGLASPADLAGQNAVADCRADLAASLVVQREAALAARGNAGTVLLARR